MIARFGGSRNVVRLNMSEYLGQVEDTMRYEENTQGPTELAKGRAWHGSSTKHTSELHRNVVTSDKLSVIDYIHTAKVSSADMDSAHINIRALLYSNR